MARKQGFYPTPGAWRNHQPVHLDSLRPSQLRTGARGLRGTDALRDRPGPGNRSGQTAGTGRTYAGRRTTEDTSSHVDGEFARQGGRIFKKPRESGDLDAGRLPEGRPRLPSVCHRQWGPDGLLSSGSGRIHSELAARAAIADSAGKQPACRRLPAQVERRGTRSRCSHRAAGTRRSARANRPRRDHVRSAGRQRAGTSNGCQTSVPGGRGRQCERDSGAVAMADYGQVTSEDVLDAARRRRPLCDEVAVDNPVTAGKVLAAFETRMEQRQDLGVVNRALNVFLEPRNPFEPERTRKPKREAVIFGTLVAVVAAAFLFFNLAAPRLQVYP